MDGLESQERQRLSMGVASVWRRKGQPYAVRLGLPTCPGSAPWAGSAHPTLASSSSFSMVSRARPRRLAASTRTARRATRSRTSATGAQTKSATLSAPSRAALNRQAAPESAVCAAMRGPWGHEAARRTRGPYHLPLPATQSASATPPSSAVTDMPRSPPYSRVDLRSSSRWSAAPRAETCCASGGSPRVSTSRDRTYGTRSSTCVERPRRGPPRAATTGGGMFLWRPAGSGPCGQRGSLMLSPPAVP